METLQIKPMLPNAVAVFVLGLCSLVLPCVGFITGIVGWALSGTGMRIYRDNPTVWEGYSMLQTGRVLSIVGTLLHALWALGLLVLLIIALLFPAVATHWACVIDSWR